MFFHFVKKGDNVYDLSKQYHIPVNRIIDDNNLEEPYKLVIGECLIMRKNTCVYYVRKGDTLGSISKKFSIPVEKLKKDNNLTSDMLSIGQKLIIDHDNHEKVEGIINGYCYQGISNQNLRKILPTLSHIAPFAYRIKKYGDLVGMDEERIIEKAKEYDVTPMLVITNIKETGGFSTELASQILNTETTKDTLMNNIKSTINQKKYQALCIDFEYVKEDEKNLYTQFIRKVKDSISVPLFVALAPKNSDEQKGLLYTAHDYYELGKIVDYVILMTYEWGYTYGEPMAVAPLNEVKKVIRYAKSKIPEEKIIMGMPNYGYDWTLPYEKGNKADSVSNVEAINLAKKYNVEIKFNKTSYTPYFNYKKDDKLHIVHFDDPCSLNAKINLALDENIKGVSIWTVTTYYPQLYLLLDYYYQTKEDKD